jgi:glutamate dehydrogenase (NAD(P)+)
MYCIREAAEVLGLELEGATTAIQGYGNAGQFAHLLGSELLGLSTVAVSDSGGAVYCAAGLDARAVIAHKRATGSVVGMPGTDDITNAQLLELDVDVLIPAALENQLTSGNAGNVKARVVAELANGPTTPDADATLHDMGTYVIPDFLCNAGGVTVSYFEQVQNAYDFYWDLQTVHERLDAKMSAAFHSVHEAARHYGVNNRVGAYIVAVSRVAEACRLRGWV